MTNPLLFEEYPDLEGHIPWLNLLEGPTPIKSLANVEQKVQSKNFLWIKQDSLTSTIYGGNKVRKLEFILADAIEKDKTTVATIGGLGTNHGLATTIFGREKGLKTILYLINQPITKHVLDNLKLDFHFGAELKFVKNYLGVGLYFYILDPIRFHHIYWLPAGGSTPLGVLGYVNAAFELRNQVKEGLIEEPDHIFVAAGTVGTMAGLELGVQLAGLKSQIHGIQVTDRFAASKGKVKKLVNQTLQLLKQDSKLKNFQYSPRFILSTTFYGGAYGRVTPEGSQAVDLLGQSENIKLETTYTGKAMAGMLAYTKMYQRSGNLLFWNTYNAVDMTPIADKVDHSGLPVEFHRLFALYKNKLQ
ncbi:MAG: pyridoxal-phosphate dependent enzyme [Candidatus Heimdallarchaeota archaeon]|nr:pyridoxal-phosphate dependent enzyme [Candidatus Heimdallarchaeota archaeon]